MVADRQGMLPITTVTSFLVVSISMTLQDPELTKFGVLLTFAIFSCGIH